MGLSSTACHQVVNRDKLQRAGEDNLFVRLLYAQDKPQPVKTRDEQEKLGTDVSTNIFALGMWASFGTENSVIGRLAIGHLPTLCMIIHLLSVCSVHVCVAIHKYWTGQC